MKLFTIGYEGLFVDQFVDALTSSEIDVLIDVRQIPLSRKPGFSKRVLAERIVDAGMEYLHVGQLGDPKRGRDAARRGDMSVFRKIYRDHLRLRGSQNALDEVIGIASSSQACLLCFERDPSGCHRSMIAEAMTVRKRFKVVHLWPDILLPKERGSRGAITAGIGVA